MAICKIDLFFDFLCITKALADENRVRALMALKIGELCVCQIVELLGLAQSTVSKHMAILKQAGLLESRKEGKWIFFRLAEKRVSPMIQSFFHWAFASLEKDPSILEIRKKLRLIAKMDRDELCQKINRKAGKHK